MKIDALLEQNIHFKALDGIERMSNIRSFWNEDTLLMTRSDSQFLATLYNSLYVTQYSGLFRFCSV